MGCGGSKDDGNTPKKQTPAPAPPPQEPVVVAPPPPTEQELKEKADAEARMAAEKVERDEAERRRLDAEAKEQARLKKEAALKAVLENESMSEDEFRILLQSQEWREKLRLAGFPERIIGKIPLEWKKIGQSDLNSIVDFQNFPSAVESIHRLVFPGLVGDPWKKLKDVIKIVCDDVHEEAGCPGRLGPLALLESILYFWKLKGALEFSKFLVMGCVKEWKDLDQLFPEEAEFEKAVLQYYLAFNRYNITGKDVLARLEATDCLRLCFTDKLSKVYVESAIKATNSGSGISGSLRFNEFLSVIVFLKIHSDWERSASTVSESLQSPTIPAVQAVVNIGPTTESLSPLNEPGAPVISVIEPIGDSIATIDGIAASIQSEPPALVEPPVDGPVSAIDDAWVAKPSEPAAESATEPPSALDAWS